MVLAGAAHAAPPPTDGSVLPFPPQPMAGVAKARLRIRR
jgi:hypothetical protein